MDQDLIKMWAKIGTKTFWENLPNHKTHRFVPFEERWPQPGFVGSRYFDTPARVVVMGQNPRASNISRFEPGDTEMFRLIRRHSEIRTGESLETLFAMMRNFMLGVGYEKGWKPIEVARKYLDLQLDDIAYLNLCPLATVNDKIGPAFPFTEAFDRSTKKQLELLDPAKVFVSGKLAYDVFMKFGGDRWCTRYLEGRRFLEDAPGVKAWLRS